MKKLLALMLVLGMTSVANASLIMTIKGSLAPAEITLCTSDIIEIDLDVTAGEKIFGYDVAFQLSNAQAAFDWSGIQFPTVFEVASGIVQAGPQYIRITGSQFFNPSLSGPLVIMNKLFLHCEEPTDVILDLVIAGTTTVGPDPGPEPPNALPLGIHQSVLIHQLVPEPATMLLLGLGGLLLRRRK